MFAERIIYCSNIRLHFILFLKIMTMYLKQLLLLLFFVTAVASCTEKTIITKHENGTIYEQYQYRGDSLKHGTYVRYSEGGVILEESTYVDGYLSGERKIYNQAGNLEIEEFYENKLLNGPYKVYYDNGTLRLEGMYVDNVLSGPMKGYYPSGALKEEVVFVDNLEDGPFKEYHENGSLMWKGTYRGGDKEFGLLEKFDENGQLVRKMMCDERGVCNTTWTIEKENS